jgi:hypothetical protein
MQCNCRLLVGILLVGVASPTIARTCDPAGATSLSQACELGFCFDSGPQAPVLRSG